MTPLVGMFAVTAVVMAVYDAVAGGRGSGKTCIAPAMFAKTMQDLYGLRCRSCRQPGAQSNYVAISSLESDLLLFSHLYSSSAALSYTDWQRALKPEKNHDRSLLLADPKRPQNLDNA